MTSTTDLRNLTSAELTAFCGALGLSARDARRVFAWAHRPGRRDLVEPGTLRKQIRTVLARHAHIGTLEPAAVERSADGTVKLAYRLPDGAAIESVLIPAAGRHTLCVSSQAGCAMGCRFCRTAALGFRRDLTAAEIVNQVAAAREFLIRSGVERQTHRQLVDNLVFMGMGEPLANYDALVRALGILTDDAAYAFSERRVTVSTCGVVPKIAALARDARVNLAVSLNAAADETRGALMPVNRAWGVDELLAACREYASHGKRVVFVEWVLLRDVNDSVEDARRLAAKLEGLPCRVNLLPYNESPGLPYRTSRPESVTAFQRILHAAGLRTLVRSSRGADISAACGQLAGGPAGATDTTGAPGLQAHAPRAIHAGHEKGRP